MAQKGAEQHQWKWCWAERALMWCCWALLLGWCHQQPLQQCGSRAFAPTVGKRLQQGQGNHKHPVPKRVKLLQSRVNGRKNSTERSSSALRSASP